MRDDREAPLPDAEHPRTDDELVGVLMAELAHHRPDDALLILAGARQQLPERGVDPALFRDVWERAEALVRAAYCPSAS